MKYRPEIDGLRAVAVLPVILFHAGIDIFSGGFIGVDVFFVISGFLITSIISEDLEKNRFTIRNFYERRARRILPALFFVMVCALPFAWMWLTPNQLKDFAQSMVSVSLFSSNIFFFLKSGYFEQASELKPLLHTWSLAVEEQYYMVFPIMLMVFWHWKHKTIMWLLFGCSVLSMGAAEWGWRNDESANFFLLPMRMWELLVGGMLALHMRKTSAPVKAPNILSLIGAALLTSSLFIFNKQTPHPSLITLIPVLGTALILYAATPATWVGKTLTNKHIVGIGLISYSAYLWHQPIFAFARIKLGHEPTTLIYSFLIMASMGLAWLSWKYVEHPFRTKSITSLKQIIIFSVIGSLFFIVLGLAGHVTKGAPERYGDVAYKILQQQNKAQPYLTKCTRNFFEQSLDRLTQECAFGNKASKVTSYVLWGDSHAAAIGHGLNKALAQEDAQGIQLATNGCPVVSGVTRGKMPELRKTCPKNTQYALNLIKEINPSYLIVSMRWAWQIDNKRFDNQEGGKESGVDADIKGINDDGSLHDVNIIESYTNFYLKLSKDLKTQGTKLVIIKQIPEAGWNVPDRAFATLKRNGGEVKTLRSVYDARNKSSALLFDRLKQDDNIRILDPSDVFCDEQYCYHTENGLPLYADDDHLSKLGSEKIANWILKSIK